MPPPTAGGAAPVLIVGQGLAGSALGWCCERAGVPFRIIDAGHAWAASRVGAGIINPLTGRRLVPTWRAVEWRTEAIAFYQELEQVLGLPLVRPLRVHRRFRDAGERARFESRFADSAVAAWVEGANDVGFWITGGAQVETARLIRGLRRRWSERGWLVEGHYPDTGAASAALARSEHETVIWCVGASPAAEFDFVPAERSKGEILQGRLPGLTPDVLLHDGRWVLPGADGTARVGATYDRAVLDPAPTAAGRAELLEAARRLTGDAEMTVLNHEAALRVTAPDRRPVIGWHPRKSRCGIFGGLGSKGALWAPALARQWLALLQFGHPVEPDVDVSRFRAASPEA